MKRRGFLLLVFAITSLNILLGCSSEPKKFDSRNAQLSPPQVAISGDSTDAPSNLRSPAAASEMLKSEDSVPLVRRLAVFPIAAPSTQKEAADRAWWKMRETLTENRRFLVASKKFLMQKDAFQPRETISTPDAILLGQVLDAQALVVTQLKDRKLRAVVLSGIDGFPLWSDEVALHPSVPIDEQLEAQSEKLMHMLLASVPYQGFQIEDPLIGKALFDEGNRKLAKVDVGPLAQVNIGDPVQWLQAERLNTKPLFQDGGRITVIAEGTVVSRDRDVAVVQVLRARNLAGLKEKALVRFPAESDRLRRLYKLDSDPRAPMVAHLVSPVLPQAEPESEKVRPLMTALASIANAALLILLAF